MENKACANCGQSLENKDLFCSNCGQRYHASEESFGDVLKDFFSNYLALDSRFGNTLLPFLFKPGYLTNRYREGKRVSYANPIRLYLILSLGFFLIFGYWAQRVGENSGDEDQPDQISTIELTDQGEGITVKEDSSTNKGVTATIDTSFFNSDKVKWDMLSEYGRDLRVSNQALLDSMNASYLDPIPRHFLGQFIRIYRSRLSDYLSFIFKNLPFMMLILVPIFALMLKLLYIRRSQFYITHLIHALHLHSFAYFLYGISILSIMTFSASFGKGGLILFISLLIVTLYSYLSFLRVYQQGKSKTIVKFIITGSLYFIIGLFSFLIEITISSLLF